MLIRLLACIAAALAALGSASRVVVADPIGIIVRSPVDAPASSATVASAMADVLRGQGSQPVIDPLARARAALDRGAVPAERLAVFSQASNLVREAWQAYVAVDSARAVDRLGEARRVARDVLDLDGGLLLYADIALRLGAVELQLGHHEAALGNFRLARALDPDREVTVASFAPDVVKSFERAPLVELPLVTLEVTSRPAGARIELDGRYLGPAPIVAQVARGQHILVARIAGHRAEVAELSLDDAQATQTVALALARDPETAALDAGDAALAVGRGSAETAVALDALLRYGELDGVVLVVSVWQSGQPVLLGQYCAGSPASCTRVVEIRMVRSEDTATACAALWRALLAASRDAGPALLADPRLTGAEARPRVRATRGQKATGARCRICRSPWLWIGVSVAAFAAGAALLHASDRDVEPVVIVDPCQFGSCPDR